MHKINIQNKHKKQFLVLSFIFILLLSGLSLFPNTVSAHGYPPYWDYSNAAVHFSPVPWPEEADWIPYTYLGTGIKDQRTQDPSNGGTAPQNYVNVSSQCTDQSLPSIAWFFDPDENALFFRWRVEQIPNTYATGPSPGTFSSTDPWKSAQWTVMIDIDGDGYREFAFHLDGSTGSPSTAVDVVTSIYSNSSSQSIDYISDPSIYQLFHNPTAFVDQTSGRILNFRNMFNPSIDWPNGSSETVWDYGTTRSTNISTPTCTEYYIDYQIPLAMLDASSVGGPTVTASTPISLSFATANSLQNPLQKDAVFDGTFTATPEGCLPFGDTMTLGGGYIPQPVVDWVKAEGCGPTALSAQVRDTAGTTCNSTTVTNVDFYYCFDKDTNNICDTSGSESWALAGAGSKAATASLWTYSWSSNLVAKGQYLIGVKATDSQGNMTWSYLTQAEAGLLGANNYGNPTPTPGVVYKPFINSCGRDATITKSVAPSSTTAGSPVVFTITITNNTGAALTVDSISDILPSGFSYVSTGAGTLPAATTSPSPGATGTIQWTWIPGTSIPNSASRTLIFTANVSSVTGTYSNVSSANITDILFGARTITSNPVDIGVGAPRLTIAKTANKYSFEPNETITYTITYSNDSPVNTTGVVITDALPAGLNFISANKGGTYNSGTRTITWNIGNLSSLEGPYTVSFNATIDKTATTKTTNTATISSNETAPASASASIYVKTPLNIDKSANKPLVYPLQAAPNNQVIYTISYQNTGSSSLSNATITDPTPSGFSYISLTSNALFSGTAIEITGDGYGDDDLICESLERCIITWTASGPLAAGASGSVTLTLQADNPYSGVNFVVNTATMSATGVPSVFDTAQIGVVEAGGVCYSNYFHDETENVGFDSPPDRQVSNTVAPLPSDTGAGVTIWAPAGASYLEAMRFYNPVSTIDQPFSDAITTRLYVDRVNGVGSWVRGEIFDYDPITGIKTSLGFQNQSFGGNQKGLYEFTITPTGGTLLTGHRLLWVFSVRSDHPSNPVQLQLQYDGTVANTLSGTTPATFANSHARLCSSRPELVITKQVNLQTASPGQTLIYTINFANLGVNNATGSQIADILPTGTSYVSATLNGSPATPIGGTCPSNVCTFNVNSSDTGTSGRITGKNSGVLIINALISASPPNSLTNKATLTSNETDPVSDAVTTNIGPSGLPSLSILKSASKTLLIPGDTVTYTLLVVNTGSGTAIATTVTDLMPTDTYYTYVAGSITGEGNDASGAPTLSWSLSSMAPGDSRTLTYQMLVGGTVPSGVTTKTNTASATEGGRNYNSNPVIVSITANPILSITKTVTSPTSYTLTVTAGDNTLTNIPVQLNTLKILENGTEIGADTGTGYIIGTNLKNSTINYTTGALHLEFITAPSGTLTAEYNIPASPGDTLEYTITVENTGGSNAENVIVTDPIPSYTIYKSGTLIYESAAKTDAIDADEAYYDSINNRTVFNIGPALAQAETRTMKVSVIVNSIMPNGTTTLTNTATASSTNTASKSAIALFNVKTAPVLTLTKSAPVTVPYPLTTLTANALNSFTITVANVQYIGVGDVISVSGTVATVTAINTTTKVITLDTPVTAASGTSVIPTIKFVLSYVNSGKADATNVIVRDTLQAGLTFLTASEVIGTDGKNYRCIQRHTAAAANRPITGASWSTYWVEGGTNGVAWVSGTIYYPSPSSFACTNSGQVVNCTVGTLPAGGSGSFIIRARPIAGTYTNSGLILSTEITPPINSNTTTTQVGALELSKSTSTSAVVNSSIGTTATYTINIRNEFNLVALGVSITDALPTGFTYASTTSVTGGACNPAFYPSAPSRVLGTDGSTYTCIAAHTADATNRPVTGANWRYYWVLKGGAGAAWVSGNNYIAENQPTWSSCTVNANAGFGAVAPFALTFTVNIAPTVGAGTYQNPVTATSTNMSVLPFDELNTTAEDVTVSIPADLKVAKTVTLTPGCGVQVGCAITYDVTVTNVGTATATAFTVNDVLPASVTYTGAPPYTATEGAWDGTNWIANPVSITATSSVVTGTDSKAYTCIKGHTSTANDYPITGANWQTYWVLGGSNPVAWVSGTTYSSATAKLTIPATINSVAGTITNTASRTASTFTSGTDTNSSNDSSSVSIVPTSITLSSFGAYEDNGNVVVEWETSSEVNTIGFFVSRLDERSGRYTQLNSMLLPSVLTPPIGGSYSLIDKGAVPGKTYTYLLTEAEANGTINTYGPFIVTVNKSRQNRNSLSVTGSLFTASGITGNTGTDLFTSYTRKTHKMSDKKKVRLNTLKELRKAFKKQKKTLSGLMIKIPVEKDGLYFFDASRISELMGISYDLVKYLISTNNLALSSQGDEVAYLSAEDSSGIFFYGLHTDSVYTKENIYWLYHGNGTTMQYTYDEGPGPVEQMTFTETVHAEEDKLIGTYPFLDPEADFWFWDQIYSGYAAYDTKNFTIRTDGAADTTSNARLIVNLQGITDTPADPDHHVVVSLNGTPIGEYRWNGTLDPSPEFEFSQQLLNNGDNTVKVKGLLDTGAAWSLFYIDSFDLTYQRLYEAKDNSLVLRTEGHPSITVYGFTVPDMFVFDITDPNNPSVNTSPAIDDTTEGYSVSFVPSSSDSIYLAATAETSMLVEDAWADRPSDLSSRKNKADYILIAPDELIEGSQYLADYRKKKGLKPMIVNVEDIMDEFNYGLSSPKAIQAFLTYAFNNWEEPPKYVLLIGDSSYDYRDNLNYGENLVPTMVVSTPMGLFTSDNILADVDSDHVPEIAIGRLPVLSSEELRDVTDKIIAFERNADNRIVMLADNADSGGDFPADSDALATIIPSTYNIRKIYLSEYPTVADARNILFDKINIGTSIINYFGHAGPSSLAAEKLLDINDMASLSNINRPFIMNAMTCLVGQNAFPGVDSLSETLMLKKDGGAAAIWAPSGLAFHFDSKALDEFFFTTALMKRGKTIGSSILSSCRSFYNSGGPAYLLDIYNLQGDPALKLW